jgi:hypothetical protein
MHAHESLESSASSWTRGDTAAVKGEDEARRNAPTFVLISRRPGLR